MKEIKFRAWDIRHKKMILIIGLPEYYSSDYLTLICQYPREYPVMQYTGLHDKNSKEIYEGDIVKFMIDSVKEVSEVFFDEGGFSVNAENTDPGYKPYLGELFDIAKVIGNRWENPELLKEKKRQK